MPLLEIKSTPRQKPIALDGPIATRNEARAIYAEIVSEIAACEDQETLEVYLISIGEQVLQFKTQLDFLWLGDGEDFLGLDREIKRAFARFATYY